MEWTFNPAAAPAEDVRKFHWRSSSAWLTRRFGVTLQTIIIVASNSHVVTRQRAVHASAGRSRAYSPSCAVGVRAEEGWHAVSRPYAGATRIRFKGSPRGRAPQEQLAMAVSQPPVGAPLGGDDSVAGWGGCQLGAGGVSRAECRQRVGNGGWEGGTDKRSVIRRRNRRFPRRSQRAAGSGGAAVTPFGWPPPNVEVLGECLMRPRLVPPPRHSAHRVLAVRSRLVAVRPPAAVVWRTRGSTCHRRICRWFSAPQQWPCRWETGYWRTCSIGRSDAPISARRR